MSIIFQLFRVEDLKLLPPDEFESLTSMLIAAVEGENDQDKRALGLSGSASVEIPPNTPPQLRDALRKRIHEVYQQLTSRRPRNPSRSLLPSQPIDQQLFDQSERDQLTERERKILEWAINCEVSNLQRLLQQYDKLEGYRNKYHSMFSGMTNGQRPKGPDTTYSPFNQSGPVYRIYNP